jgi:Uma2 family endonuclease
MLRLPNVNFMRYAEVMASVATNLHVSFQEYLRAEEAGPTKHEWLDGEVFAMGGGSISHAGLALAIGSVLRGALRGKPCRVYSSDLRVRVQGSGLTTYADVTVVCGKPQVDIDDRHSVVNPKVLVEVLSPTTESYDRGRKFAHYKQIESLQHYVLVSPEDVRIEWYTRSADASDPGAWVHRSAGAGDNVFLSAVECTLSVDEIFEEPAFADG